MRITNSQRLQVALLEYMLLYEVTVYSKKCQWQILFECLCIIMCCVFMYDRCSTVKPALVTTPIKQ